MSSKEYVAELRPDPIMRGVVLLTAVLAGVAGILVLCGLPIDPLIRVSAIAGWIGWLTTKGLQRRAAERQLLRIRLFPDGTAALQGPDGDWSLATVAADSIVLATLAWLRLSPVVGRAHTELLRGTASVSKDWRRLQVLARHRDKGSHSALGSSS